MLDARADIRPDLLPNFPRRGAQRPLLLDAERGAVSIVVEHGELRSPTHPHLVARCQQNANNGLEALMPRIRGPQRSVVPELGAHELSHRTAAGEECGCA